MKKVARVQIQWLSEKRRGASLSIDSQYSVPCRFREDYGNWLKNGWSLVFEFESELDDVFTQTARVWFLAYDAENCPQNFLHARSEFEIMEGNEVAGKCVVIEEIPD